MIVEVEVEEGAEALVEATAEFEAAVEETVDSVGSVVPEDCVEVGEAVLLVEPEGF